MASDRDEERALDSMRVDMDLYTADPADLVSEPYDNDLNERLLAEERAGAEDAFYFVSAISMGHIDSIRVWTCLSCGALVDEVARKRHGQWHRDGPQDGVNSPDLRTDLNRVVNRPLGGRKDVI